MYKFSFIVLLMLLLAGCDNGQPARTVEEFKADKERRHSMLAICKNNPGEKSLSPNCINAQQAENEIANSRRGYSPLPSVRMGN
ncbi:EexN family lipoprotein [Xanthomonas arboricola]|uniref:EexN family lipoprotein n=1 Tax=Xanthomonas arboricola TaxID=56448 RepID=UPI0009B99B7A|nr:EexN family lipoprotein [Xanthomonas arboricola]MEA5150682.1 EexN family lipoprotein [Xanthomonas arboricola]UQP96882.1 EexN family lipoprotein [Xanthomonas arboricola pv. juglandis]UQQ01999.1 EexN family lipoprotein [Xanthomonas arboricola pv. juglandis]CAD7376307.1 EexN family lipoprotein [Xanthomonas arboricola]